MHIETADEAGPSPEPFTAVTTKYQYEPLAVIPLTWAEVPLVGTRFTYEVLLTALDDEA